MATGVYALGSREQDRPIPVEVLAFGDTILGGHPAQLSVPGLDDNPPLSDLGTPGDPGTAALLGRPRCVESCFFGGRGCSDPGAPQRSPGNAQSGAHQGIPMKAACWARRPG